MPDADRLTIRMSVWVWNGIDGSMDNRATNAMWEYWNGGGEIGDPADPDVGTDSRCARAIREEGGRQVDNAWLRPADEMLHVTLTTAQWRFVLETAQNDLPVYDDLAIAAVGTSQREMLESAQLCRAAIQIVARALDASGSS